MKTAAELKAEQEAREKANQEAERAKEEADRKRQQQAAEARVLHQVRELRKSWFASVEDAAKRDRIRFVVLAEVVDQHAKPAIKELVQEIEQAGYKCQFVTFPLEKQGPPYQTKKEAREVGYKGMTGWLPAETPKIGQSGSLQSLIVVWA